jgi:fimbrial chaperone protein
MRVVKTWARPTGLALVLLGCATAAPASALKVSPVRVVLGKGQATTTVELRNDGDAAVLVQTRLVSWSQDQGQDVYAPTQDVLASPPIFTVAPGTTQIIRLGLRREPEASRELAYRIFLEEVPAPERPGSTGVRMLLRIGLPIFVVPRTPPPPPAFTWRAESVAGGPVAVTLDNTGGRSHVQVIDLKLGPPGADTVWAEENHHAYVLPGQTRTWTLEARLPEAAHDGRVRLRATTDVGNVDLELPLPGR